MKKKTLAINDTQFLKAENARLRGAISAAGRELAKLNPLDQPDEVVAAHWILWDVTEPHDEKD